MSLNATTTAIGTHQLTVEEDTIFLVVRGDYLLPDAKQVNAVIEELLCRVGRAFIAADQRHAGGTPPEVRRYLVEWNRKHRASGAVMFGGGVTTRTVATLVLTAFRLLKIDSIPTCFTETETQARAWIAVQREKLLARHSG